MRPTVSAPSPLLALTAAVLLGACGAPPAPVPAPSPAREAARPTAAEAIAFADSAERVLRELSIASERAGWVMSTNLTHDTEQLAAQAEERLIAETVRLATRAARYDELQLPADARRKLTLLKLSLSNPAPSDAEKTAELTRILARMESVYGSGKYCRADGTCFDLEQLSDTLANSRNPESLKEAWAGWRTVSRPMREDYRRFVELANEGARGLGFADLGAMWRSNYDMPPDEFAREVERLWNQVKPLYDALHCHVRAKLGEKYGFDIVPQDQPIRADLLGNMWAQEWGNIFDVVATGAADPGYDLTALLRARQLDAKEMVRYGERFFTSVGFEPLPATFWERSLFTKPRDREVVCHASAWNVDWENDLRIKMCIDATAEDFQTIHHELGHNFYQRAYNRRPFLFQNGAIDAFHEAVGDAIALSVTPSYLVQLGLLEQEPGREKDIGLLMRDALDKIAFLPFGLLVDQWRWNVFSGEIAPAEYNDAWWDLRTRYQGVRPPVARTEQDFDPGAKYHVPANVPYTRYFLARILQFQFHRALCQAAGYEGPLNRCSIYGNAEAGRRLAAMLEMGASRPWPDALEALTGQREMDATAIVDYFAPLKTWLDEQNRGRQCGW